MVPPLLRSLPAASQHLLASASVVASGLAAHICGGPASSRSLASQAKDRSKPTSSSKKAAPRVDVEVDGEAFHVKRPPSAFNLYLKHSVRPLRDATPGMTPRDAFTAAAQQFQQLSPSERAVYDDKAERVKAAFEAANAGNVQARAQAAAERAAKYSSPFNRFVKAKFAEERAGDPSVMASTVLKRLAERWKAMSDGDKAEYGGSK